MGVKREFISAGSGISFQKATVEKNVNGKKVTIVFYELWAIEGIFTEEYKKEEVDRSKLRYYKKFDTYKKADKVFTKIKFPFLPTWDFPDIPYFPKFLWIIIIIAGFIYFLDFLSMLFS